MEQTDPWRRGSGSRWLDSGDAGLKKSSGARAPCEGLGQVRHGLLREGEREVTKRCEARVEEEKKRKGMGAREEEGLDPIGIWALTGCGFVRCWQRAGAVVGGIGSGKKRGSRGFDCGGGEEE